MLTQIITFLIFVAVIGCILYGRRLIRTEKIDAVFGNPERALGGTHWIIVGSSFLLLVPLMQKEDCTLYVSFLVLEPLHKVFLLAIMLLQPSE